MKQNTICLQGSAGASVEVVCEKGRGETWGWGLGRGGAAENLLVLWSMK